jgi:hypothetical protein
VLLLLLRLRLRCCPSRQPLATLSPSLAVPHLQTAVSSFDAAAWLPAPVTQHCL